MSTKRCYRCKADLPLDKFATCASRKDGLQTMCRGCRTEYMRERRATNPAQRDYDRAAARRRIAADPAAHREREWQNRAKKGGGQIIPIEPAQLALRLSMFGGCWLCGGKAEQVDHVKPLCKGGAHMLANVRPICAACNVAKGKSWPFHAIPMATATETVGVAEPPIVHVTRQ